MTRVISLDLVLRVSRSIEGHSTVIWPNATFSSSRHHTGGAIHRRDFDIRLVTVVDIQLTEMPLSGVALY